jgi:hypothetical protein
MIFFIGRDIIRKAQLNNERFRNVDLAGHPVE